MEHTKRVRIRATVHYDGKKFHGSQVQPTARTVQGALEASLGRLFDGPVRVDAAGRTDAGVHATGQEILFEAPASWRDGKLREALNAVLPSDIWVERLREAPSGFHPRYSATGRRYEYYIGTGRYAASPLCSGRIWAREGDLQADRLRSAARIVLGHHCFAALSKIRPGARGTTCCVEKAEWSARADGVFRFTIVADRFLHRMVRYLVHTMVDIAAGQRDEHELAALLRNRPEVRPPEPAPVRGLYLTGVRYTAGWNRRPGVPGLGALPCWDRRQAATGSSAATDTTRCNAEC